MSFRNNCLRANSTLNTPMRLIIMSTDSSLNYGEVIMDGEATSKEKLVRDLKNLVADAEELLRATASQAGEKITEARQKIEQSLVEGKKALADAEKTVRAKSKEYADTADDYVRENPWTAVGVAAGVGLVLGLLMRGK
jgi:ElaB/YqjD/DUF883 family membrane-anchored ribosome-binding protein